MNVELVLVYDRARTTGPIVFERAREFDEETKALPGMEIPMKEVVLQQVSIRVLRRKAKVGVVKPLVGFAKFASKRNKNFAVTAKRNELDGIPRVIVFGRIPEKAPVLVVSWKGIERTLWLRPFLTQGPAASDSIHKNCGYVEPT